ncbi:MAG: rhamnan synthesis F family protein [Cyclobacteriaceae bacterium]|nr:rhamnan synthesis F family protein [Cyclobacteriaceae bacterium]MDX5465484.1 rhamnan synthesis F family protein [Cyclobacteriaceae bacterium]
MNCCIFVHYGQERQLPKPDFFYVSELSRLFTQVIVVTNTREFHLVDLPNQVKLLQVKNEGYDFGMFYKVFQTLDLENLDQLALANDSNLLLGDLEKVLSKGKKLKAEFWGLIDSHEKPWFSTHEDNYHLQSHFLVWEKEGIQILRDYFQQMKMEEIFSETNPKELRRKVINAWEIGLSQFFLSRGVLPKALFAAEKLTTQLRKKLSLNLTMKHPEALLELGYPFLKKKYIQKNTWGKRLWQPKKRWEILLKNHLINGQSAEQWISELKKK